MGRIVAYELKVNGVDVAIKNANELKAVQKQLNGEFAKAKFGTKEYEKLRKEQAAVSTTTKLLRDDQRLARNELIATGQAAGISEGSYRALEARLRVLDDEYKRLGTSARDAARKLDIRKQTKGIREELKAVDARMGVYVRNVGNYANAWKGLGSTILNLAGIGAVSQGLNEVVRANAQISDSIADVSKTSGIAINQVSELSDLLKFRDTRTSLDDQLKIAEIGGRQGFDTTDQLKEFVEAIDVANVALGDQFNNNAEETTTVIAGLRNVLTTFQTDEVGTDLLRLANALNVLETQGVATAPAIADLTNRIGGVAVPLGASEESIFGLATTLDELQISAERGGTAVSNLLVKLAANPEAFASFLIDQDLIGTTEDFVSLVQDDIVSALALVARGANEAGTENTEFADILGSLGITGARVTEVFAKLGGATDTLAERTETAREALASTDSLYEEFEKKNETLGAAIDKLQNAFVNFTVRGDIQGGLTQIINGFSTLVNALAKLPRLINENRAAFAALVAVILTYNKAAILAALQSSVLGKAFTILSSRTKLVAAASRVLSIAMTAIPLIAVGAAVFTVVKGFQALTRASDAASKAQRSVAKAQKDISREAAVEQGQLERLIGTVKDSSKSIDERREALEKLKTTYPGYFDNFDLEKSNVSELTSLQKQLNKSILESVAARAKATALDEIYGEILEKQLRIQEIESQGTDALGFVERQDRLFGNEGESGDDTAIRRGIEGLRDEIEALQVEAEETDKAFQNLFNQPEDRSFKRNSKSQVDAMEQSGDKAESTASSFDALKERQSELSAEIQNAIATGQPYQAQLDELRALQARVNRVQERYNALIGDESKAAQGSLAALKARRSELEKQLEITTNDSQVEAIGAELADLDVKIAERQARIDKILGEYNATVNNGSLAALRAAISELDQDIANASTNEELTQLITKRVALEQSVSNLEKRISGITASVGPVVNPRADEGELLARKRELDKEIEKIDEERIKRQFETAVEGIERQRDAKAIAASREIQDQEQLSQTIAQIDADAQAELLDLRLSLADIGSAEYLAIQRERIEAEKELEFEKLEDIAEKERQLREQLKSSGLKIASEASNAIFNIERQNAEQQVNQKIEDVNLEYDEKLKAAEGDVELTEKLEAEKAAKIAEIERNAAIKRKEIARTEAIIQTALAIAEAAPNPALIAEAVIVGAIQIAAIEATSFAGGGYTGSSTLPPDKTGHRPVGIVHDNEYVVPKDVLFSPAGSALVHKLDKMRLTGSHRSDSGYFASGGFTGAISIPTGVTGGQSSVVTLEVSDSFNEGIERAVLRGSKAGSKEGLEEGMIKSDKRKEGLKILEKRTNV